MQPPFFSIIIPALNEEKLLPHLLNDLVKQSFQDFAVIIVDGKSQDRTVTRAKTFTNRLKLTVLGAEKRNVCHQRNLGAKESKSPWLIFMDADNRIPSYFLQGVKYRLEEQSPHIMTVYVSPDSPNPQDLLICRLSNLYIDMQKKSSNAYVLESMMVFKRETFQKLHGFSEKVSWGEGNELLRRAYKQHIHLTVCKSPTYIYSTRRLKKEGTLKLARNIAVQELYRLLQLPMKPQMATRLYPMKGGTYFDDISPSRNTLLQLLAAIGKPKQFTQELKELVSSQNGITKSLEPFMHFFNAPAIPSGKTHHHRPKTKTLLK